MSKHESAKTDDLGADRDSLDRERADIRDHVAGFRRLQAEQQARREARWDKISAETRTQVERMKRG